ncbi:MAG TPA: TIGR01906 family membrane protein [Candidatus Lachnoclostridium stercoripullorum]|uniref:TIGR01906 family membrane protein n=1 Tax=Candidatus Lachnoclostridium stercoripullorum TaxID=2838635 RepID=A0A9D2AVH8_9FIRM|nr:TIGR01906 family membrane protein [Candidatus Lachnoclostridium stercoripullorum]
MKLLQRLPGIVCAFCLMIVFLITSVEAVTYWTPGYYEHEYEKYNVTAAVRMEMDDLLQVTDEMMDYLRGDRDDLHVMTVVDGSPREFFNAREIAHMEDVRGLFLGAITLRRVCLAAAAVCVLLMTALKADLKRTLPRMLCVGTGLFFLLAAGIGLLIASDFSRYFVVFHHIFFDNDLWILNPATDLLINIVPEPFFADTALRIGLTFGGAVLVFFAVCLYFSLRKPAGDSRR